MANSLEKFYFDHSRKLYFYAEKRINDEDAARHIVDDAFIINQGTILTKDETTALRHMYTTIRCDCIDWLRKRKATPEERLAYELWASGQADYYEDTEAARTELLQRLMDAIEKLPDRQKEVIKALLNDGKAKEAAEKMGIKETTFSNTKGKALEKLFRLMTGGDAIIWLLIKLLLDDDWKN
jgi:RNA polymerase sigma factor (sigma-70 family)